jgi:hypothetical protein
LRKENTVNRHLSTMKRLLATLLLLAAAAVTRAADFEITPLIGYRVGGHFLDTSTGSDRNIQEHSSFGLALDLRTEPDTQWELTFSREDTAIESPVGTASVEPLDLRIDYLQLGGTYFWSEESISGAEPYAVGGLGVTRFSPLRAGLDERTAFSANVGVGLRVPLAKRLALRLEGRAYLTLLNTTGSIFCGSGGAGAACAIHASGSALWQIEALVGLAFGL